MDYKAKARAYYTAVSNYDQAAVTEMLREDYIQHNPKVPTGRAAFVSFLPKLKEYETKIVNVRMLNDGRYVVMHHVWKNADPFGSEEMVAFHIIRFDAEGLIAEHWNVMTELTAPNRSGRSLIDGPVHIFNLEETEENKARARELLLCWIGSRPLEIADRMESFFQPEFHQHHPCGADGIKAYQSAVDSGKLNIKYRKKHRLFGEGNLVLAVSEGALDEQHTAFYDLFRFENGLIAEHWNIYQAIPKEELANDNTMFNFHN